MARYIIAPKGECATITLLKEHRIKLILDELSLYLGQCIFQPSSEKFLFKVGSKYHRDPKLVKVKRRKDYGVLSPK